MKYLGSLLLLCSLLSGGYIGYLDALVNNDEYQSNRRDLIQNELFSLDNQIAHYKFQIRLSSAAGLPPVIAQKNTFVFCDKQITPAGESLPELEAALSELQKKEKKIWEYTKTYQQQSVNAGKISEKSPYEWVSNIVGKATEIRKGKRDEKTFIEFWSQQDGSIPESVKIYATSYTDEKPELNPLHHNQISAALRFMPEDFLSRLKAIYILHGEEKIQRGSAGMGVVFINAKELNIFPTLIHEFGHLYDFHSENQDGDPSFFHNGIAQLTSGDPSVTYYQISWENNQEHRGNQSDFCSCYSTNNPQEDFAEAFAFYVLQGSTFEKWAEKNPVMKQKYEYFKKVFNGKTFTSSNEILNYSFNVIDLPIDYKDLF